MLVTGTHKNRGVISTLSRLRLGPLATPYGSIPTRLSPACQCFHLKKKKYSIKVLKSQQI